jgi:hypothetical protein
VPKEIKTEGLEYLYHKGDIYSIVLRNTYKGDSISFFTPDSFSQQFGYLLHKKGAVIKPHEHRINTRTIQYTQEVLIIREGKVKVNFFDTDHQPVFSELLESGDVILLCGGGHGFEFLADTVMIEIKQGPYTGANDKVIFEETKIADDSSK